MFTEAQFGEVETSKLETLIISTIAGKYVKTIYELILIFT